MSIVERTIGAFAGPRERAEFAREIGVPPQTVQDWLGKKGATPNIPHWRRPALIQLARKRNMTLDPDIAAYLTSTAHARDWPYEQAA